MRMRGMRLGSMLVVLLVALLGSPLPLAADKGDPGPAVFLETHVVLDAGATQIFWLPDDDEGEVTQGGIALPADEHVEAMQIVKFEGFEGSFPSPGWQLRGNPTWDDESHRARTGSWSGWCAGSGPSPPSPYAPNMEAFMIYGPFSLECCFDAKVDFSWWLDSEMGYDYFGWGASLDGTNFYGTSMSGRLKAWDQATLDLANVPHSGNYLGQEKVWVAFWFRSDASNQFEGAYVDDIVIRRWRYPNKKPKVGYINPNSGGAPAGNKLRYFTTRWFDGDGWNEIRDGYFHLGKGLTPAQSVRLRYNVAQSALFLSADDGTYRLGCWPGQAVSDQTQRVILNCAKTSVIKTGNIIQVRWALKFKKTFRGFKNMYLKVEDVCSARDGWTKKGTWRVK